MQRPTRQSGRTRHFDSSHDVIIKPSKKNVKTFLDGIRQTIKAALGMSAADLIDQLSPKIRGWANYHRHVVSKRTFGRVNHTIFSSLWQWARRRHPNKNPRWFKSKYFERRGNRDWSFFGETCDDEGRPKQSGYSTPRAPPSNDMSRSKAKLTRTIQPMKPTLKNAKRLTCRKRFGVPVLFAFSGMNNVDSARSAIQKSPGPQAGAFITASPV